MQTWVTVMTMVTPSFRVLNTNVFQLIRQAFAQSHSQSQARLKFVNCSQNRQLGLCQNQCTIQNIPSLFTGGDHSRVEAYTDISTSPPLRKAGWGLGTRLL